MKGSEMVTKFHNMEEYINILSDAGILLENGCSDDTVKKIVRYISFDSQDIRYNTLFIYKNAHFLRLLKLYFTIKSDRSKNNI